MANIQYIFLISIGLCLLVNILAEEAKKAPDTKEDFTKENKQVKEYFEGSLCANCKYCKFCDLCDDGCPCETKSKRRNCHMCKYCKYCVICRACSTFCAPGSIMDYFSSAMVKAYTLIGAVDEDALSKDLFSVKSYIDEYEEKEKKIDEL